MRTRQTRDGRAISLHAECLEKRELLAVTPISFDAAIGQIVIRGTSVDDVASVVANGADMIRVRFESAGEITALRTQRISRRALWAAPATIC
jgi:hypothetical protein